MKMLKRKYEEIEHQNSYGHGKKWFRVETIGKGKSGSVFLAILKKPKWRITHFPIQMAIKSAEMSVSASLQREKLVLDNLQGSCNYIRKCFGEELTTSESGDHEIYNLFLEYGSGGTLADLVQRHHTTTNTGLPEIDVRRYTKCILLAILSIHKHGYVLRDLKPENIILVIPTINSSSGKAEYIAKIGDYGSAEEVETIKELRLSGPCLRGDVKYMSPEAMIDEIQLPASDIWALGCIVVEMLTGKSIWGSRKKDYQIESNLRRMAKGRCLPLIGKLGKFSKEALSFLLRCLERNPRDRFTAKELLSEPFVAGILLDGEDGEKVTEEKEEVVLDEENVGFSPTDFLDSDVAGDHSWSDDSIGYTCEEWDSDEEIDYFSRWNEFSSNSGSLCVDSLDHKYFCNSCN